MYVQMVAGCAAVLWLSLAGAAWGPCEPPGGAAAGAAAAGVPAAVREKIAAAAPPEPYARPARPRKLLVYSRTTGYRHDSIPTGIAALSELGRRSGAFEVTASEDPAMFERAALQPFDAVLLLNTTGELFAAGGPAVANDTPKAQRQLAEAEQRRRENLLAFVRGGKGLIGIHAATDCCYQWPEYGRMIGGYFDEHPWHEPVVIRIDEPEHALTTMFAQRPLEITDEIYQFKPPYSRARQRVLLSLDTDRTDMKKPNVKRSDGDFAVSWIRREGKGRVFYCSLGHRDEVYWNPLVLRHYLAGIQYALGDLEAVDTPGQPAEESRPQAPERGAAEQSGK